MKYKENQVPKTLTEDPQIEEDTIGVRWEKKEHQVRLESKLLLE